MPRRLDADERAARVTRATWRLLARTGLESLSVRNVAEEAELPPSSMRYLFPTRTSIQVATMRALLDETERRVCGHLPPEDGGATAAADPAATAAAILLELLPLDEQRHLEISALVALAGASSSERADPELHAVQEEVHDRMERLCRSALTPLLTAARTEEELHAEVRRTHALIDGLALHVLQRERTTSPDWAEEVLRRHVGDLAAG